MEWILGLILPRIDVLAGYVVSEENVETAQEYAEITMKNFKALKHACK